MILLILILKNFNLQKQLQQVLLVKFYKQCIYLEMNLTFLYNLVCQLEYILLFVKFLLKLMMLRKSVG